MKQWTIRHEMLVSRRRRMRWWVQQRGCRMAPEWLLPLCDALVWLLKTSQEREWDRRCAREAEKMVFIGMSTSGLRIVNDRGETKSPWWMGATWMTPGEPVKPLLRHRLPKGYHLEVAPSSEEP